jgi:uncharacterized protein YhbP (UPF0306 family)
MNRCQGSSRLDAIIMESETKAKAPSNDRYQSEELYRRACSLINTQRTMVLATEDCSAPWATPVYFVYSEPGFYFFSSPNARHIQQAGPGKAVAAAIFADSNQWEDIQGLQMSGSLREVNKRTEQLRSIARFLFKFPFAKPFLQPEDAKGRGIPNVSDRVRLYAFTPKESYYMNNRLGFGKRFPVDLKRRS